MSSPTVVSLLEQRRDTHFALSLDQPHDYCRCGAKWPCPDRVALDVAIRLLTEAAEHLWDASTELGRGRFAVADHDLDEALGLLVANPELQETT